MSTYSELYEKVKPAIEASRESFKEYKESGKPRTFSEIFNESVESTEKPSTYNQLYESYQKELEPLTEQEAIYILGKLDNGEKLTESELQKLEELNTVNWSLGRTLQNLGSKVTGITTARQRAYNAMRKQGALQAKQIKDQKALNWAQGKYGGQLKAGQDLMAKLKNDPKVKDLFKLNQDGSPMLDQQGNVIIDETKIKDLDATKVQGVNNIFKQLGGAAAIGLGGALLIGGVGIPAATAAAAKLTAGMTGPQIAAAIAGLAGKAAPVAAGIGAAAGAGFAGTGIVRDRIEDNNIKQAATAQKQAAESERNRKVQLVNDYITRQKGGRNLPAELRKVKDASTLDDTVLEKIITDKKLDSAPTPAP